MNDMAMEAGGAHLKNKEIEKKMKAEISERWIMNTFNESCIQVI